MIDIAEFAENLRNLAKNFLRNKGPSTKGGPDIAECANIAEILGKKLSAILPPVHIEIFVWWSEKIILVSNYKCSKMLPDS